MCQPPWLRPPTRTDGYRPWWTADEWRKMERLRAAGVPVKIIAKKLGRSRLAVSVAWSRYGPSPNYQKLMAFLGLMRMAITKGLRMIHNDPDLLQVVRRDKHDSNQIRVSGGVGKRA